MTRYFCTILILSFTSSAFAYEIIAAENATISWPSEASDAIDLLRLEDNSVLMLTQDVNVLAKDFVVGENVKIIGMGASGKDGKSYKGKKRSRKKTNGDAGKNAADGENGGSGANGYAFRLRTESFTYGSLTIDTSGGDGGHGGYGMGGGKGGNAKCGSTHGGDGGKGGNGGSGGAGGNAGDVEIRFTNLNPQDGASLDDIQWIANGGKGGARGQRGKGGKGGNSGSKCFPRLRGGDRGKHGKHGQAGEAGAFINVSERKWLDFN